MLRLDPDKIRQYANMSVPAAQATAVRTDQADDLARADHLTHNRVKFAKYFPEAKERLSEDPRKKYYRGNSANRGQWDQEPAIHLRSVQPPTNTDTFQELCKWLYHEHGIMAIHVQNKKVSQQCREIMMMEGNRLYGSPKDNETLILEHCLRIAENHEDARLTELEMLFPEDFRENIKNLVKKGFIEIITTPARIVKVLKNAGGGEYIPSLREEIPCD